jgi:hypothetical protein
MPFPPRYHSARTSTGRGFNVHGSKSVYYYVYWCLCFAPGLITQIGAAGLDECMPWWIYGHDGRAPFVRISTFVSGEPRA